MNKPVEAAVLDWLAFWTFDHRVPWQRWACRRVATWFELDE